MADSKNWAYIQTPKTIFEEIEKILENEEFKKLSYFKPKDVAIVLFRKFIQNPHIILDEIEEGEISVIETYDDKILLKDSKIGIVLVQIDKERKLQCYDCKEDPHDNRYVNYCLKNKDLWEFLKSKNVKLRVPRE